MTTTTKLTVNTKWLSLAADQIERDAKDSLTAWVLLGQSERYSAALSKAAVLRHATEFKNMGQRREYLRNNGVEA